MDVTLLYFDGCPSWRTVQAHLDALAGELDFTFTRLEVATIEHAEALGFRGSPTILVDGRDVFAEGHEPVGLSCRVYPTPGGLAGAPTVGQLRARLRPADDQPAGPLPAP